MAIDTASPPIVTIDPAILYFGTPVVLVSTLNEDGSPNLAPMSSAWWLGRRCMLGFGANSKTPQNLRRSRECVLNLPSVEQVAAVDRLALTTGSDPVPEGKVRKGYRHLRDKFGVAGLTPVGSETVSPPRAAECPVQLEAVLAAVHPLAEDDAAAAGHLVALEVRIQRVHVHGTILMHGEHNRIDPDRWQPLIMSFQHFYGLRRGRVHDSTLATILESQYRPR
jgi:flavin reductase (DIM6/NTAB) family NADH-FMN oxidoreductase RutF